MIRDLPTPRHDWTLDEVDALFARPFMELVYDAATTFGGSGGPVFGPDGTVVGVNHAGLPGFDASNFGVPIRHAKALLE